MVFISLAHFAKNLLHEPISNNSFATVLMNFDSPYLIPDQTILLNAHSVLGADSSHLLSYFWQDCSVLFDGSPAVKRHRGCPAFTGCELR